MKRLVESEEKETLSLYELGNLLRKARTAKEKASGDMYAEVSVSNCYCGGGFEWMVSYSGSDEGMPPLYYLTFLYEDDDFDGDTYTGINLKETILEAFKDMGHVSELKENGYPSNLKIYVPVSEIHKLEDIANGQGFLFEKRNMKESEDTISKLKYREVGRSDVDIDDVYDEFESQNVHYEATKVARALEGINWQINAEDVPLCLVDLCTHRVNLDPVIAVTYDKGEFTEWLENDQDEFDGGYQVIAANQPIRYFGWNYGDSRIKELFIQKKTTFTTKAPVTESKKLAKKALKEGMGGCFYVIHESPIGYKGRQGWIDDYSELTSDIGSAEQYNTFQEAVDMLYAIEDYVENFNDNEGIRATIQCVNPDDENQVLEDMAVVDIQKRWGVVDCEPVSGEQNLINCGYRVEDSEPSMGYNL